MSGPVSNSGKESAASTRKSTGERFTGVWGVVPPRPLSSHHNALALGGLRQITRCRTGNAEGGD